MLLAGHGALHLIEDRTLGPTRFRLGGGRMTVERWAKASIGVMSWALCAFRGCVPPVRCRHGVEGRLLNLRFRV